jgi:hypothetical protein
MTHNAIITCLSSSDASHCKTWWQRSSSVSNSCSVKQNHQDRLHWTVHSLLQVKLARIQHSPFLSAHQLLQLSGVSVTFVSRSFPHAFSVASESNRCPLSRCIRAYLQIQIHAATCYNYAFFFARWKPILKSCVHSHCVHTEFTQCSHCVHAGTV